MNSASFETGSERARASFNKTQREIERGVSGIKSNLDSASAAAASFFKGFAAAAVGAVSINTLTAAISRGITEFKEAEQSQQKLSAIIKATGSAAGLTAKEINTFAESLAKSRLVTVENVQDAASVLLTFKSVSGETFKEAIRLAQDLSATFGGDLLSSTTQLGKALEDPVNGISALRRVGVSFTDVQKELIANFVETGRVAEAQGIILKTLAEQVGGAGAAEGNSLAGAFFRANENFGDLLASFAESTGIIDALKVSLEQISALSIAGSNKLQGISNTSLGEQSSALKNQLAGIEQKIAAEKATFGGGSLVDIKTLETRAAQLREAIAQIENRIDKAIAASTNSLRLKAEKNSFLRPDAPYPKAKDQEQATKLADDEAKATETLAKAAAIVTEAKKDLLDTAKAELDNSEKIFEATKKNNEAGRAAAAVIAGENKIRAASKTLKGDELAQYKELIEKTIQFEEATRKLVDARQFQLQEEERLARINEQARADLDKANKKIIEDQKAAATKASDDMRDILVQPFKDLASDVAQISTDMFADFLSKGSVSAKDLASTISDTLQTTVAGTLGSLLTLPINTAIAKIANGNYKNLTDFATQNPTLTGVGVGTVTGSLASQALGQQGKYAGVGGAIGGAAGAIIGSYIAPGVGTYVGGAIGGAAGGAIGGLFGAENNLGNDRSSQAYRASRGLTYSDNSFSPENRNVTNSIIENLTSVQKALEGLGGSIEDFGLRIEAGNKTGITVNGKKYATAQEALAASIETLIGNTSNLSATQQTILQNTNKKDAASVINDLNFGATFDDITATGTDAEKAIRQVNIEFTQLRAEASRLGLDVNKLTIAQEEQVKAINDEYKARQDSLALQIAAISAGSNSVNVQFAALEQEMNQLGIAAKELGIPLESVAAAAQRAMADLQFSISQQTRGFYEQLASFRGDNSLGTQLHILETQMRALLPAAAALGVPLEELTKTHVAAAKRLYEQDYLTKRSLTEQIATFGKDDNLGTQLYFLETAFLNLKKSAEEAGIPIDNLTYYYKEQQKAIKDNFAFQQQSKQLSFQSQIAGLVAPNTLDTQLLNLQIQIKQLAQTAKENGYSLNEVRKAEEIAIKRLKEAFAEQQDNFRLQLKNINPDNTLASAIVNINAQFKDLYKTAKELNIPLSEVRIEHEKAIANAKKEFQTKKDNFKLQLREISGEDGLNLQIARLNEEFKTLSKTATELGVPIDEVSIAFTKARKELEENNKKLIRNLEKQDVDLTRQIQSSVRGVQSFYQGLIEPLRAASVDTFTSPLGQIETARRELKKNSTLARGGDLEAIQNLAQNISTLQNLRQQFLGSGGLGATIQKEIENASRGVIANLEAEEREAIISLPKVIRETTKEASAALIERVNELILEQKETRKELALRRIGQ